MKKGKYKIYLLMTILILYLLIRALLHKKIGTIYAVNFSNFFKNNNIKTVDWILNPNTIIRSNEKEDIYKNVRENVMKAFDENIIQINNSYGFGSYDSLSKTYLVTINIFSKDIFTTWEAQIKINLFSVKTIMLYGDDELFNYIFYNDKEDLKINK